MNNKGFTLIELLVVITLLGVLGIIVTVSLNNTLKNTEEEKCENYIKEVEEAACVYVELSRKEMPCLRPAGCTVPVSLLYEDGMIEENYNECEKKEIDFKDSSEAVAR